MAAAQKKSRSTVAEGNHSYPPFYACYLLKSLAIPNSKRTYVGSTPNPPRRIRQHNGELKQGAWRTSRFRPWVRIRENDVLICLGSPDDCLWFEWAWQNPDKSRHLRVNVSKDTECQYIFKRDARRNSVERKAVAAATLVRAPPFIYLPLHIRCFSKETFDIASAVVRLRDPGVRLSVLSDKTNHGLVKQVTQLAPADPSLEVTLDLKGLLNSVLPSDETGKAFLDLSDTRFRTSKVVLGKWSLIFETEASLHCHLCQHPISDEVRS
ncbi:hypothetical protein CspHIS471_0509700 [Cutaneotrichosporon sp. HIS471]|nr:hypothetical protein CspHIS471_0509700 [Cutaneotrichosporon sp. HIS471]